jgi:hypothetical protein
VIKCLLPFFLGSVDVLRNHCKHMNTQDLVVHVRPEATVTCRMSCELAVSTGGIGESWGVRSRLCKLTPAVFLEWLKCLRPVPRAPLVLSGWEKVQPCPASARLL